MSGPRTGDLRIRPAPGGWRLSFLGGSDYSQGGGAAGACELEAEGPLSGDRLTARVAPFEGELMSVSAKFLEAHPASVTVVFSGESAAVTTNFAGCGVGADLSGRYTRTRGGSVQKGRAMTGLTQGANLAAAQAAYPDARLKVIDGYPWARFAVQGGPVLTFDGENGELKDGSNSQDRIGDTVTWSDLRPDLKVTRIEPHR